MYLGADSTVILEFKRTASKAWHHLRSRKKDLQRVLERDKSTIRFMAILVLLLILTVKFFELLIWIRHWGKEFDILIYSFF